jgi:hypothetical protein
MITDASSQRGELDFHPSLGDLLVGADVERLVGHDLLELAVLALQLLEPLDVVGLHPAVLVAPAVQGLLGDLQRLCCFPCRLSLREHLLRGAQLADDLFGGVPLPLHLLRSSFAHCRGREELSNRADRFQGVGPVAEVSPAQQTHVPSRSGWTRASQITGVILLLIVGVVAYLVLLGVLDSTALSATFSAVGTLAAIVALIFFSGQ